MTKEADINTIIESLSPNERKVIPFLKEKNIEKIAEKTELNKAAVLRSLEFLGNKKALKLEIVKTKMVELGVNGLLYKKKGLPERRLLNIISEKKNVSLENAKKLSSLNDNEFKASLGALKRRALINMINNKIMLAGKSPEISKKTLEEQLIETLPVEYDSLKPEQKFAIDKLKNRKDIIEINVRSEARFTLTEIGKKLMTADLSIGDSMIESLTPEIIKSGSYKGKKFRRYDITSPVPKITGGKSHFVNQAIDYARKIWTELGFKEMKGNLVQSSFWNFDALFTAQDHPVREEHDTFYIKDAKARLPDKELVEQVKQSHEKGVANSKGWQYEWKEKEAKKVLLRTHTTPLSAQTLSALKTLKNKKGKYFAIGKCFRNETVDWSHGFEFYQTEGIVIDKDANFRNLLGYLKEFYKKMGFEKIRFQPGFFPYTEPSVEVAVWHPEKKVWLELGGAGIFRPEMVVPLLGEWIPVLAWGQGLDRIAMDYYQIKDLREMYENNLSKLRQKKAWMKC